MTVDEYLQKEINRTRNAEFNAIEKSGVTSDELYNLQQKLRVLLQLKRRCDVVYCKDCKYFRSSKCNNIDGLVTVHKPLDENDFCSRGERK